MAGEFSFIENHQGLAVPFYLKHKRAFKTASGIVHLLGAIHFTLAALLDLLITDVPYDVNPVYSAWSGQFKFLTYWNVFSFGAVQGYAMLLAVYQKRPLLFHTASTVVRGVSSAHFWFAAIYDYRYVNIPASVSPSYQSFGGHFKYLTYWNLWLQAAYMTYALGIDIYTMANKNVRDETTNKLVKIKDNAEASVAFPIAVFVSVTFWGLMAVDRELVLPSKVDPYFPSWLNHMEHTNIIIFQLLEVATSPREYPSKRFGLVTLGLFQTSYIAWMHLVYYKSGVWVYPIFKQLTPPLRVLFLAGSVASGFVFYFAGSCLNWLLWSGESKKVSWKPVSSQAPNQSQQ